jgi:hypothetical protein
MLTAGDIQYEPQSQKMFEVTNSILSMMSGDAVFFMEIYDSVYAYVRGLQSDAQDALTTREVVQLFIRKRNEAKIRRSEAQILGPLGLSMSDFIANQGKLSPKLGSDLATELINFEVPGIDVILAGADPDGSSQIYVINDGDYSCCNAIGFASVGSGSRHAESQFMMARHAWNSPLSDSLFLTYVAKRRAEVAPGVGAATDLLMIQPGSGIVSLNTDLIAKLENEYGLLREREESQIRSAIEEMARYVDKLRDSADEGSNEKEAETVPGKSAPTNETGTRKNARRAEKKPIAQAGDQKA